MLPIEPGVRHRAAAGWNGSKAAGNIAQQVITCCQPGILISLRINGLWMLFSHDGVVRQLPY